MVRRLIVRLLAVLALAGLAVVQWTTTTPGVVTFLEFRVLLLVGGLALIVVLLVGWVDAGVRPFDVER